MRVATPEVVLLLHRMHASAAAGNALVWCAADDGQRIKAFRAPKELGGPRTADAGCNTGPDNGMSLQYTLNINVKRRRWGRDAGLHVLGTKVFAVKCESCRLDGAAGMDLCCCRCTRTGSAL